MEHGFDIWLAMLGAPLLWCFGMLVALCAWSGRIMRGSALWLLAPVFWPLTLPLWLLVLRRERREAAAYQALPHAVRLVPEGVPYGSPVSSGLVSALELERVHQVYRHEERV
jgi:Flp pilus assembly protein TadB